MFNQTQNQVNVQVQPHNCCFHNRPVNDGFAVVVSWVNSRGRVSRQFHGGFPDATSANVSAQQHFNQVVNR